MTETKTSTRSITLGAESTFESDEELLEALNELKDMSSASLFNDRTVNIDSEDRSDISVIFFGGDGDNSLLHMHLGDDEGLLHVHATITESLLDDFVQIFDEVLKIVGKLGVFSYRARHISDEAFSDLELPLNEDAEFDVVGLRIRQEEGDFILQKAEEGTSIVYTTEDSEHEDFTWNRAVPEGFLENQKRTVEEFLEGVIKND